MVPFAGWEMPVSYKSIISEHNAVRARAGIFDVGHMGLIKIVGDGAATLIQKTATNDLSKLSLNHCQYSVLCNESGGTIDDLLIYKLPMYYLIVCNASNTEKVLPYLKKQAKEIEHADVSLYENYCMLSVQGPRSEDIVSQALNVPLAGLRRNQLLWWRDIIISKTGYTGEDGYELMVAKKEVAKIWEALIAAGAQPCGLGARDTLRLEAGFPLYGHEYDEETSPIEVGYGWAVKFDKGDFIGKAALLKQKKEGPKKKLVGLEIDGRLIARSDDSVFDKELKLIGKVTSGTFSPTLKKPIALAYVAAKEAILGNQLNIEIRGKKVAAKVVAKSFYKR